MSLVVREKEGGEGGGISPSSLTESNVDRLDRLARLYHTPGSPMYDQDHRPILPRNPVIRVEEASVIDIPRDDGDDDEVEEEERDLLSPDSSHPPLSVIGEEDSLFTGSTSSTIGRTVDNNDDFEEAFVTCWPKRRIKP